MNSRYGYLIKNLGLLSISKLGTNILVFFLVPIYTSILSTEEYGIYEIINTTINLLIPILTVNIATAVFRFTIDDTRDWKNVFSVGIKFLLIGSTIVALFLVVNFALNIYKPFTTYAVYIFLLFVSTSLSEMMGYFARGQEKIKQLSISGIIGTVTMIVSNILLLLVFKQGVEGYLWAMILSHFVPAIYLCCICHSSKYITPSISKDKEREMIAYSRPLIYNSIGWWINNVSDRYIVSFFCGAAANGVYSIAYKIPSILTAAQNIFSQAWTISAVKDFDKKDQNDFFDMVYNLYNWLNVFICTTLILTTKVLANLLFAKEFYNAWVYVPFLLISVVFGSLSGYFGSIFSAVKQSKVFGRSTLIGATVNTALNIILVLIIGPIGAAISTSISYFVVYIIRLVHVKKYINLHINFKRDCTSYIILVIQSVILLLIRDTVSLYAFQTICLCIQFILFRWETKILFNKLIATMKKDK